MGPQQRTPPPPEQNPPPPPIPPPGPAPTERLLRTALHSAVILVVANALTPLLSTRPLGRHLIAATSACFYLPWSVGVSAGLNADQVAVTILAITITIATFPDQLLSPGTAALLGVIVGLSTRRLLLGARHG